MAENDNQDLVGVSRNAGRILVPRDQVDSYVAKGYKVRDGKASKPKKEEPKKPSAKKKDSEE